MLSPKQIYLFRGHPTSPGQRDFPGVSLLTNLPTPSGNLSVLQQGTNAYGADGQPGIPRYVAPVPRAYHADPGNIGFMGMPKQPGLQYYGELPRAGFDPWNSRNEKLRRAMIEAVQSGGV